MELLKYDPLLKFDQDHDEHGKFASTAAASAASADAAHAAAKEAGDRNQTVLAAHAALDAKAAAQSPPNAISVKDYHKEAFARSGKALNSATIAHQQAAKTAESKAVGKKNASFGAAKVAHAASQHYKDAFAHHAAVKGGKRH